MIPYRNPSARQMDYGQLMQLMQMKQMMDTQQGQQQPQAPKTSGIGDLISSFGGGSAGGAASSYIGGGAGTTAAADVLAGTTMPSVGPTLTNAAFLPEAGTSALGSVALPAGVALATFLGGRTGLNMLKGKQKSWKDASLADNAGRVALAGATGGLSEVANKFLGGHKSTKDRQADRWKGLAKDGKVPDWFLQQSATQDQGVDDRKLASGKLGGRDVWATSGMFDTFGKDWATTGDEMKREQIAKQMLDNKLFDTKKGVTYVTDKNKAMDIYNSVLGNKPSPSSLQNLPVVKGPAMLPSSGDIDKIAPQLQQRKDTPGFKDGKRIDYSRR